ncbi:MAG: cytosolic protein [Calditrichaeota bacterium]|nr:MAG: cytosolic protein [Calditrichota bacterium]
MKNLRMINVVDYVEKNISEFHNKRFIKLENLRLTEILKRKNPYLFKAKNILTAQDLVKYILDAYLSTQEEIIFGEFLEGLAIYINHLVFAGRKSSAEGIDLEFDQDNIKYIVSIKSGPNWGNSRQIAKMKDDFNRAKKVLRTNAPTIQIEAVNGCCYGRDNQPDKGDYSKYCGQRFWQFISGEQYLYTEIIEPLGHKAKEKNDQFLAAYSQILNRFTFEFGAEFCTDGRIDWEKLVQFNSAA